MVADENNDASFMAEWSARLVVALDHAGVEKRDRIKFLRETYGVTNEAARCWLRGLKLPVVKKLLRMAIDFDVAVEWFLTGRGAMSYGFRGAVPGVAEPPPPAYAARDRALLDLFDSLTTEQQEAYFQRLVDTKRQNDTLFAELASKRRV